MKKQILVLSFSCLFALAASAQVDHRPRHAVHVAYLGEMISHPGLSIGYEKFLNDESRFQIFMRANVGFYHHYRNNNTYMLTLETGYRRNFKSGWFLEQSLGLGYFYRQIHSDGQFAVNENGSIVEKKSLGNSFLPFACPSAILLGMLTAALLI